ncbi:MAG: acetyl-CoA carboxylase biotin carboxyl carrier protein [Oligoflexales bacterium]|nr:acetyl-CoA carboxylase biotin carboxyl carrier protein [Oligoflexales bacterium]
MDLSKIEQMMKLMRSYGMHEFEWETDGQKVKLVQSPGTGVVHQPVMSPYAVAPMTPSSVSAQEEISSNEPTQAKAAPKPHNKNLKEIKSPFVGTLYAAPAPGSDNFVQVGQKVKKGDTLCIVEAMKLMNEIEAEKDGIIAEVLVENEEPVEYDQVLFLME